MSTFPAFPKYKSNDPVIRLMPDPNGSGESKLSGGQFGMEFVLTFIVVYAFCASRDARYERTPLATMLCKCPKVPFRGNLSKWIEEEEVNQSIHEDARSLLGGVTLSSPSACFRICGRL